jgi:hypothetical protein
VQVTFRLSGAFTTSACLQAVSLLEGRDLRTKSRKNFLLLLGLLVTLACRTSACADPYQDVIGGVYCRDYVDLTDGKLTTGQQCYISCPGLGRYDFDLTGDYYPGSLSEAQAKFCPAAATLAKTAGPTTFAAAGETITYDYVITNPARGSDLSGITVQDDKTTVACPGTTLAAGASMTCSSTYTTTTADVSAGSITNTAQLVTTAPSVPANTASATVTLEKPQQSIQPGPVLTTSVLTGDVYTLCDTVNRPVNLRLVDGTDPNLVTQELAAGNLNILIAQRNISSTCKINAANASLLSCTYPSGLTTLPAKGQVIYKNNVIKTFSFDGENGCAPPPSTSGSGAPSTGGSGGPAACDPHVDNSCPLDCTDPANADLCG